MWVLAVFTLMHCIITVQSATQSDLDYINTMSSKLDATLREISDMQDDITNRKESIAEMHQTVTTNIENSYTQFQGYIDDKVKNQKAMASWYAHVYNNHHKNKIQDSIKEALDTTPFKQAFDEIKNEVAAEKIKLEDEKKAIDIELSSTKNIIEEDFDLMTAFEQRKMSDLDQLDSSIYFLSQQVQSQQFNEFEKARTDGYSGLKQVQTEKVGRKNYISNDFSGDGVFGINDDLAVTDHSVSLASFAASLNGIEFRTKCCGYELKRPRYYNSVLDASVKITYPDVPSNQIFDNGTAEDQIVEMREWFKAFQKEDKSKRNYKSYFRKYMTYLEGSWIYDDDDMNDGSIKDENLEKFQFTSETGFSDKTLEYLPKTIIGFNEATKTSIYARFSYRFSTSLIWTQKKNLFPVYDPAAQKRLRQNSKEYRNSYAARFNLNFVDSKGQATNGPHHYTLLDSVMENMPGKDNMMPSSAPMRRFPFSSFVESKCFSASPNNYKELDKSFYHRSYKVDPNVNEQATFSDRVYVAQTSQKKVAGPSITLNSGVYNIKNSYAVPVEAIFVTPLQKWNPYKVAFKDDCTEVTGDGSKASPYSASCPDLNYKTPASFFTGNNSPECVGESAKNGVHVLRGDGTVGCFYPSGIKVVLPKIFGMDERIRLRYPVIPLVAEGDPSWKKIDALIDSTDINILFSTGISTFFNQSHSHILKISQKDIEYLKLNPDKYVKKATEADSNSHHLHILSIKMTSLGDLYISDCNSGDNNADGSVCFDNHVNTLTESSI